jgi:hypothetical protein
MVVAGSTVGFARGGPSSDPAKDKPEVEATEAPEAREVRETPGTESSEPSEGPATERKQNHGFFVSQAAHCEDVDDPDTPESPDFSAPEDCTGSTHGSYVSSVAKSSAGQKDKEHGKPGGDGS